LLPQVPVSGAGSTQRPETGAAGSGIGLQSFRETILKGELIMKTNLMMASALVLTLAGTGCATKKYVAKSVAPVESRVSGTEAKNTEQDKQLVDQEKQITDHGQQLDALGTDLSRTKERLTDADAKAVAAGQAAQKAGERADSAQTAADGAKTYAEQGLQRADQRSTQIERTMDAMNRFKMLQSETVLFSVNQSTLSKDAKATLDEMAKAADGQTRFVIEVQGFTDKTGSPAVNEALSQARAAAVSRYLVNEHKIAVRSITTIGSGYALPVADDKTRDGRKMNRRVEIRLWVPEASSSSSTVASAGGQGQ
jgi:outer membrane protein OmpA-like peptidoglycan-associated protein